MEPSAWSLRDASASLPGHGAEVADQLDKHPQLCSLIEGITLDRDANRGWNRLQTRGGDKGKAQRTGWGDRVRPTFALKRPTVQQPDRTR